jgi:hypothetical protein
MKTKEIKMPEFGKAVNVDKINSFSRKQLKALNRMVRPLKKIMKF